MQGIEDENAEQLHEEKYQPAISYSSLASFKCLSSLSFPASSSHHFPTSSPNQIIETTPIYLH